MAQRSDPTAIPLECHLDGEFEVLTFAAAHELVWKSDFAWVIRAGWYRLGWSGFEATGDTRRKAELAGEQFGFALLTQTPLTITDFAKRGPITADDVEAFQGRAARFNRLVPKQLRKRAPLFEWCPVIDRWGRPEPAYRIVPGRTTLVVAGVDPDAGIDDGRVPWRRLQNPPSGPHPQPRLNDRPASAPRH
ncbi:MAG: hypothetical protein JXQ75_04615 [Phycisphaerae bacterium]|nr:hypothetical protein [Phycisphaerae bacterium]